MHFYREIERFWSECCHSLHAMLHSSLKIVLEAKTCFPISIAATTQAVINHSAIKLLAEHFNTELARSLFLLLRRLDETINIAKAFSN